MSNREFFLERRQAERRALVAVLKAIPQDKSGYRPDPKSRSARELAWLLAEEEAALVTLVDTGRCRWKETPPPPSMAGIVADFEKHYDAANARIAKLDDASWAKTVKFSVGDDGPGWEESMSAMVWGFFFDEIHHRGQLTTHLRPMGSKVPSIYGPSADEGPQ
jgi:uncharacterized damage-inducible protein DinB